MTKTITIASRAPMAVRLMRPDPNPGAPGLSPELDTIVLNGAGNEAGMVEGITNGVDAEFYNAWLKANPNHPVVTTGVLRVVPEDEAADGLQYGYEPALAAATQEAEAEAEDEAKEAAKAAKAKSKS